MLVELMSNDNSILSFSNRLRERLQYSRYWKKSFRMLMRFGRSLDFSDFTIAELNNVRRNHEIQQCYFHCNLHMNIEVPLLLEAPGLDQALQERSQGATGSQIQRPSASHTHDDSIIDGEVVIGKARYHPVTNGNRVTENFGQRKLLGARNFVASTGRVPILERAFPPALPGAPQIQHLQQQALLSLVPLSVRTQTRRILHGLHFSDIGFCEGIQCSKGSIQHGHRLCKLNQQGN